MNQPVAVPSDWRTSIVRRVTAAIPRPSLRITQLGNGTEVGIVRGRKNLRAFVAQVFATQPPQQQRFRMGLLSDGNHVTWEYPRQADAGEQMDIVEVMEIRDGLIHHHRVYWGWYSVSLHEELQRIQSEPEQIP
jgi:predicted SnoaL-like aldol condensation-catalyzing enzyme